MNTNKTFGDDSVANMTKREAFAQAALTGLCANSEIEEYFRITTTSTYDAMLTDIAARLADALILALNAPPVNTTQ